MNLYYPLHPLLSFQFFLFSSISHHNLQVTLLTRLTPCTSLQVDIPSFSFLYQTYALSSSLKLNYFFLQGDGIQLTTFPLFSDGINLTYNIIAQQLLSSPLISLIRYPFLPYSPLAQSDYVPLVHAPTHPLAILIYHQYTRGHSIGKVLTWTLIPTLSHPCSSAGDPASIISNLDKLVFPTIEGTPISPHSVFPC